MSNEVNRTFKNPGSCSSYGNIILLMLPKSFQCNYIAIPGEARMHICILKKQTTKLSLFFLSLFCGNAFASTSLVVNGHAGLSGVYTTNPPPLGKNYFAFRVPVGLTLEANPSDKFSIYLGLDYAYNNYPVLSNDLLGQSSQSSGSLSLNQNNGGFYSPLPFSNMVGGNQPFGQKTDTPTLTTAYFTYQTDLGLFKAGRMPRNWGLGIWYNDQWSPTGGTISTSDAIAFTTDLTLFDVSVYYEKYSQSLPQTSDNNTGLAYSIEARLKNDPADAPSSGVTREIGIAYSTFEHSASNTTINTIDGYGALQRRRERQAALLLVHPIQQAVPIFFIKHVPHKTFLLLLLLLNLNYN